MDQNNSIKTWAEDDRPREKLVAKGAAALSYAELLGILIGSGTKEHSAVAVARNIMSIANNNLNELGKLSINELLQVKGIGLAKAISISAVMELGRRRQIERALDRPTIKSAEEAADLLFPLLQDVQHEMFCVLYLNNAQMLLKYEFISSGGLTATVADIRMILKNALLYQAAKLIVAHNHPSGNKKASEEDKRLTIKLKAAAAQMDIILLDHIIVAGKDFTSFANEGMI